MNNRHVFSFLAGSATTYLVVVAIRIYLFNHHVGAYGMHPVFTLLALPLIVALSSCLGGLIVRLLSLFFELRPSSIGTFVFGLWCTLPAGVTIDSSLWSVFFATSVCVPFILVRKLRRSD